VSAKPPFGGSERVLSYLVRYTHRTAIANSRLAAVNDKEVAQPPHLQIEVVVPFRSPSDSNSRVLSTPPSAARRTVWARTAYGVWPQRGFAPS
jgi:hypothetical protein